MTDCVETLGPNRSSRRYEQAYSNEGSTTSSSPGRIRAHASVMSSSQYPFVLSLGYGGHKEINILGGYRFTDNIRGVAFRKWHESMC